MTKKEKLSYLLPLFIALGISLIGFIIGSIYDKSISQYYYDKNQLNVPVFSGIMCVLGPLVTNFFGSFSAASVFFASNTKSKAFTITLKVLSVIGLLGVSFLAWDAGAEFITYIKNPSDSLVLCLRLLLAAVVIITDVLVVLYVYKTQKRINKTQAFWIGLTMFLIIAVGAACGEVIKYLASRPRPRIVFPGQEAYREWYQWNPLYGFKVHECKSFISGHAINAMGVLSLFPLFISLTRLSKKPNWLVVSVSIGAIFAFIIGVSRLFALAHFLTDICGGFIASLVLQIAVINVMALIEKKTGVDPVPKE